MIKQKEEKHDGAYDIVFMDINMPVQYKFILYIDFFFINNIII